MTAETAQAAILRRIAAEGAETWAQAIESMAGERPEAVADHSTREEAGITWWEYTLGLPAPTPLWIGAGAAASRLIGHKILDSAGIAEPSAEEIQNTFLEIAAQAFTAWGSAIGRIIDRKVFSESGQKTASPPESAARFAIVLKFTGGESASIAIALPRELTEEQVPSGLNTEAAPQVSSAAMAVVQPSRTLDLLLEVELPVAVSFGRASLPLREVLKLTAGAIIELNRSVNEPVEVIVNNCVIARGEVVVVDGYYGIRIQHIVSRQERLRSLN